MKDREVINDPVLAYRRKKAELAALGQGIKGSAKSEAILFVDLADSTTIKQKLAPEEWLDFIFGFIETIGEHAKKNKGSVVKAIGDEVMLSFDLVSDAEKFIEELLKDRDLNGKYRYKVAADYGEVYHFQFEQSLSLDPYGTIVDRCARIAKLADAGAVLCSSSYSAQVESPSPYISAIKLKLKGFEDAIEIFLQMPSQGNDSNYLKPLIEKLNTHEQSGYRYISRKFDKGFFTFSPISSARPFLLRELLNVPKLPMSLIAFMQYYRSLENRDDAENYLGFLVEWQGKFESYNKYSDEIRVMIVEKAEATDLIIVNLQLLPTMLDVVRNLRKGQAVRFRGILFEIHRLNLLVNYVDLEIVDANGT